MNTYFKDDHHGFEKDINIYLIHQTQSSDPLKESTIW